MPSCRVDMDVPGRLPVAITPTPVVRLSVVAHYSDCRERVSSGNDVGSCQSGIIRDVGRLADATTSRLPTAARERELSARHKSPRDDPFLFVSFLLVPVHKGHHITRQSNPPSLSLITVSDLQCLDHGKHGLLAAAPAGATRCARPHQQRRLLHIAPLRAAAY